MANPDARGRLVLLEKSTAGVLTLDLKTGTFKRQATLPDLPGRRATPCPELRDLGPGGALFVSDYGQAVIWRIPATGGTPKVWFARQNAGPGSEFGTTGLVYQPARRAFLIAQQTTTNPLDLAPRQALPAPGPRRRQARHAQARCGPRVPLELPDGFGIARSGRIYVANVG